MHFFITIIIFIGFFMHNINLFVFGLFGLGFFIGFPCYVAPQQFALEVGKEQCGKLLKTLYR